MPTNDTPNDQNQKPMTRRQLLASMGAAGALLAAGAGFGGGGTAYAASSAAPANSTGIYYNVKDFGARGTGRLDDDDGPAIQAAVNSAAYSGGTVFFPAGTYTIRSTIFIKSKVHLLGEGAEATVLKSGVNNLQMLIFGSSASHCSIQGFTIEGIGVPNGASAAVEKGVTAFEASHILISRCAFKYITNGIYLTRAEHVSIHQCTFQFILGSESLYEGYGIVVEGGVNHTIAGNHFKNVYRNCIYLTSGSTYSTIVNNVIEQCKDTAILLSSKLSVCSHHLIEGNMISASGLGSEETSCTYGIRLKDASSFNTVVNNVVAQAASAGIQLDAEENAGDDRPYGNSIAGNTVYDAPRGIAVLNGDGNAIKNNDVRKAEAGIVIDTIGEGSGSSAKGNLVTHNSLFQCSAAAVRIGSARCQLNTVFGNAGTGNTEGLQDSGTDTGTAGF